MLVEILLFGSMAANLVVFVIIQRRIFKKSFQCLYYIQSLDSCFTCIASFDLLSASLIRRYFIDTSNTILCSVMFFGNAIVPVTFPIYNFSTAYIRYFEFSSITASNMCCAAPLLQVWKHQSIIDWTKMAEKCWIQKIHPLHNFWLYYLHSGHGFGQLAIWGGNVVALLCLYEHRASSPKTVPAGHFSRFTYDVYPPIDHSDRLEVSPISQKISASEFAETMSSRWWYHSDR